MYKLVEAFSTTSQVTFDIILVLIFYCKGMVGILGQICALLITDQHSERVTKIGLQFTKELVQ